MRTFLVVLGMLHTAATVAAAQPACEQGRVTSAETAGRCCWPAQRWSDQLGRCEGPPECPAERVAEGDQCVAREPVPVAEAGTSLAEGLASPDPAAPAPDPTSGWESLSARPLHGFDPHPARRADPWWAIAGTSAFLAGYVGGIVLAGVIRSDGAPSCAATFLTLSGIPLLGSLIALVNNLSCYPPASGSLNIAVGASSLVEVAGFVVMLLAATTALGIDRVEYSLGSGVTLRAAASGLGLTF